MRIAVTAVLLIAAVTPLHAQRRAGPSPSRADSAMRVARVARTITESIVFDAEPRSFQVVRVPVPAVVRDANDLTYEIEPQAAFAVIGARRGVLTGAAARAELLVTLRVPADARAGAHMAAHALFRSARHEVDVPIETRVKPMYRIGLAIESKVDDIVAGERVDLRAILTNLGNATDTVRVAVETPAEWHAPQRDVVVVIPPGEVVTQSVRIAVPKSSGAGSFFVRTTTHSRAAGATALTTLSVGNRAADVAPPGPTVRVGIAGVGIENGSTIGVAQLAVSGPLTTGIHIDGRFASRPATSAPAIRGMARVGAYVTEPHLAAWSSTWRVGLGSTVSNLSDVLGVNAGGRGVALDYDDQTNIVRVAAARQIDAGFGASGSILGGEYERRFGITTLGAGLSRLDATGFSEHALSALSVQAKSSPSKTLLLEGAVAYRDYDAGSGIGWIAGIAGALPRTRAQLRAVHAPGGSAAFARAENEIVASAQTTMSDALGFTTSYYRTDDTNGGTGDVASDVFSFAPLYRLGERSALRAELRKTDFEVAGDPFSFTNGELHFGAGASAGYKRLMFNVDAGVDRLSRGIRSSEVDAADRGERVTLRATASRPLLLGVLQLEGSYERSDRGTGFVPEQVALVARADHAQLPGLSRNLFLDGEIGYSRWGGIRSFTTLRAGATYLLHAATEISATLERNPLLHGTTGHTPFVFALRVERSFGLPRMMTGRAAGIIFQDYNGNGHQDVDEPGMPNIAVRRGDARATTDRDGRYRFWEQGRGATIIDIATLPLGWIVGTESQDGAIALVPTTRVEVTLQPGVAERMRNLDLTTVTVSARDARGRSWVARRTAPLVAIFEALPVGSYEITIDASGLAEPLRIEGPAPRVNVTRETAVRVTVPVAGRPLRFRNP